MKISIEKNKFSHFEIINWLSENYELEDLTATWSGNIACSSQSYNYKWTCVSYYAYTYHTVTIRDDNIAIEFLLRFI